MCGLTRAERIERIMIQLLLQQAFPPYTTKELERAYEGAAAIVDFVEAKEQPE